MRVITNTTTERLEGYARARGLNIGVIKCLDNASGVFFISSRDGVVRSRWTSLGWTVDEAETSIRRLARS